MKKLLVLTVTALVFVLQLTVMTLAAQSGAAPPSAQPAGSIAGRITDRSESPIDGAIAEAFSCSDDTPSGSAVTDKFGQYLIGALGDGCYHVRFSGDQYHSCWLGKERLKESASDVTVVSDKVSVNDGQLSEAGSFISGTVKTMEGKPLPGAWVTAFRQGTGNSEGALSDGRSDAKGAFSVCVSPGSYYVIFMRKGYVTQLHGKSQKEPKMVDAAEGQTVRGIDAALAAGGRITGVVTDESGKPLQGIYAISDPATGTALPVTARSDAEGKFALDGLPTGKYRVIFGDYDQKYQVQWHNGKSTQETADLVAVTAPKTSSGIKGVLRQSGGISGRVTGEGGNAISRVLVYAEPLDPKVRGASAFSDETGAYTIAGLSSATYKLSFRVMDGTHLFRHYHDAADPEGAQPIEVTAPQVISGIDQVLPSGTLIIGSVSSESAAPIPGAMVVVYPAALDSKVQAEYAFAGPDGTFSVPLPEGEYLVEFSANSAGYLRQWSGNRATRSEASPVTVSRKDGAQRLTVVLSRGATISGTVKNGAGIGIAGVTVTASDSATGDSDNAATTDAGGKYLIKGLKSGSFTLAANGSAAGYLPVKLPGSLALSAPAALDNVDLVLAPGGSVSGKVTDPQRNPIAGVEVSAHDPVTWDEVGKVFTGPDGQYKIGGLPGNGYRLRFEKSDSKYSIQWYKGKFRREDSVQVEVVGTASIAGIDATLTFGVPLTGIITDAKGSPLFDAKVEVYGASEDEPFAEAQTDRSGSYTVPGLAPGNYRIRFSHDDQVPRWYGGRDRMTASYLKVGDTLLPPLSAALVPAAGTFSGKLMNPQGQKIGQAWITAIDAATGIAAADERICECNGQFHTPVPAGAYRLRVERHGQVVWFGGNSPEEAIPLEASGEMSGLEMVIDDKIVRVKQVPGNIKGQGRL